ncbi:hypothetical protein GW17_00002731 [Ensete ventricosum]|nr:hypothetical protein GW17_00002731 [Ensete ventricosum]
MGRISWKFSTGSAISPARDDNATPETSSEWWRRSLVVVQAMGGGGDFVGAEAAKRAELYEGRITGYFILACVVGSLGGSLFGYDLGLSSKLSLVPSRLLIFVIFSDHDVLVVNFL